MSQFDNLDELYQAGVNQQLEREATQSPVAPTGQYNVQPESYELQEGDNPERAWDFGKKYARFMAPILSTNDGKSRVIGRVRFNASWNVYRNPETGRLDMMSSNWGQLTKALRAQQAITETATIKDVLDAATKYPVRISVTENYRTDEGWRTVAADAETSRKEYREAGYEATNFLRRIMPYREE